MRVIVILVLFLMMFGSGYARDPNGQWADSKLNNWFQNLTSKSGTLCCGVADGVPVEEWGIEKNNYWVMIDGQKLTVPDNALVTDRNISGKAIVWVNRSGANQEKIDVRCFMPGDLF